MATSQSSDSFVDEEAKAFISRIQDHIHSVRIVITMSHPTIADSTSIYSNGSGSFSAQYGSVREWVLRAEAQMKRDIEEG
jgi:hypothetical protein